MNRKFRSVLPLALGAASLLAVAHAHAAIPADHLGKPYKGTPTVIPGRVDLANLDTGGAEVSYHADHNRMNSAGWADDNTTYPSEADKYWYYMGHSRHVQAQLDVGLGAQRPRRDQVSSLVQRRAQG